MSESDELQPVPVNATNVSEFLCKLFPESSTVKALGEVIATITESTGIEETIIRAMIAGDQTIPQSTMTKALDVANVANRAAVLPFEVSSDYGEPECARLLALNIVRFQIAINGKTSPQSIYDIREMIEIINMQGSDRSLTRADDQFIACLYSMFSHTADLMLGTGARQPISEALRLYSLLHALGLDAQSQIYQQLHLYVDSLYARALLCMTNSFSMIQISTGDETALRTLSPHYFAFKGDLPTLEDMIRRLLAKFGYPPEYEQQIFTYFTNVSWKERLALMDAFAYGQAAVEKILFTK